MASTASEPHTGPDFPSPESFYPHLARVWAQEGTATIHYCVDETGRLSGAPALEDTSGDHDLDDAALALAKAGDGHYLPGYRAGKAVADCAKLKVRFVLQDDPGFPTLSRRSKRLTSRVRPQWMMLNSGIQHLWPPLGILSTFAQGDPEQLKQLQDFVRSAAPLVEKVDAVLADYIAAMDEVGRAEDVSEAERTAFSKNWQKQRSYLRQMQQVMFDMRAIVVTINDVIHYVQGANPPVSALQQPSEQQSVELRILIKRGRREFNEAQDRLNGVVETFGQAQSAADSPPNTPKPSAELYIILEAVGRADGLALPTANVAVPQPITSVNDVPGCSIPRPAFEFEGGTSLLQLHLSDSGAVSSIELERTSGSPELDATAVKCVPGMRFRPATQSGQPVASLIQFPLKWSSGSGSPRQKTCEELKPKTDLPADRRRDDRQKAPAAIICSCWEESGRLNGPRIIESSGIPRLDAGALKLAASSGFGKPLPPGHPGCDAYRTQFDIH